MRSSLLLLPLLALGCHGAPRQSASENVSRVAMMDSATARRICQSPDSVIAGTKECVLLDQSRRSPDVRRAPQGRP